MQPLSLIKSALSIPELMATPHKGSYDANHRLACSCDCTLHLHVVTKSSLCHLLHKVLSCYAGLALTALNPFSIQTEMQYSYIRGKIT